MSRMRRNAHTKEMKPLQKKTNTYERAMNLAWIIMTPYEACQVSGYAAYTVQQLLTSYSSLTYPNHPYPPFKFSEQTSRKNNM